MRDAATELERLRVRYDTFDEKVAELMDASEPFTKIDWQTGVTPEQVLRLREARDDFFRFSRPARTP